MRDAKQVFERYEIDLIMLAARDIPPDTLRFNVVEYVCRVPKIDPIKMGKALVDEGIEIVFDDASISRQENERKRKKVCGK